MPTTYDPKLRYSCVQVYEALRKNLLQGHNPTKIELASDTHLSFQTVSGALSTLMAAGYITSRKHRARTLRLTNTQLRLTAMPPMPWEEDMSEPRIWGDATEGTPV